MSASTWMSDNIHELENVPLDTILLPGSHDAGMSVITDATSLGGREVTQTQTKSVLEQLRLGVRCFDIRPIMYNRRIMTGHYAKVGALGTLHDVMQGILGWEAQLLGAKFPEFTWQGANGQSLGQIVNDVNEFTRNATELVVLQIGDWSLFNRDREFNDFNDDDYTKLFHELDKLDYRYHIEGYEAAYRLTDFTLSRFIGKSSLPARKPAVLIISQWRMDGKLGDRHAQGYYNASQWYKRGPDDDDTTGINVALTDMENFGESTGLQGGRDILAQAAVKNDQEIPALEQRVVKDGKLKRAVVWADRIEDERLWKKCLEITLKYANIFKEEHRKAEEKAKDLFP